MRKHLFLFVIILVVLIGGFFLFFNKEKDIGIKDDEITSFEECVKAGYPILESYPEQCYTTDGKHFVREFFKEEKENLEDDFYKILNPKYIFSQEWKVEIINDKCPPKFRIVDGEIDCETKDELFNKMKKKVIDGQVYCIEEYSEGAAGSVYIEYTYSTFRNDNLVNVSFVARYVQCYNYSEPQKSECENERKVFSFNSIADKVSGYAFNESLKNHQEKAIISYLLTQKDFSWQNHEDSHRFCSIENLGPKKELFPFYFWVFCGEYIIQDGQLKNLSGASLPAKINYPNELSFYNLSLFFHEIPLDGFDWEKSVKEIFPKEVQKEITNFRKEGRVKEIIEKNEDQAWINILAWEEIKSAIKNCQVEKVFQAHSKRVVATLKSGEELIAVEPKIDEIMSLVEHAVPQCGEILMGTE